MGLGVPWPEQDPAGESSRGIGVVFGGPPGTAAGPDFPHRPGVYPPPHVSSTCQGSHTGGPVSCTIGDGSFITDLSLAM